MVLGFADTKSKLPNHEVTRKGFCSDFEPKNICLCAVKEVKEWLKIIELYFIITFVNFYCSESDVLDHPEIHFKIQT